MCHVLGGRELVGRLGYSRLGIPGPPHGQRLALDDHDLFVPRQVCVLERLLRVLSCASPVNKVFAVDLVPGDSVAEHHGHDDERDPPPDRGSLPVLSAPMSGPCGKALGSYWLLIARTLSFARFVL